MRATGKDSSLAPPAEERTLGIPKRSDSAWKEDPAHIENIALIRQHSVLKTVTFLLPFLAQGKRRNLYRLQISWL